MQSRCVGGSLTGEKRVTKPRDSMEGSGRVGSRCSAVLWTTRRRKLVAQKFDILIDQYVPSHSSQATPCCELTSWYITALRTTSNTPEWWRHCLPYLSFPNHEQLWPHSVRGRWLYTMSCFADNPAGIAVERVARPAGVCTTCRLRVVSVWGLPWGYTWLPYLSKYLPILHARLL